MEMSAPKPPAGIFTLASQLTFAKPTATDSQNILPELNGTQKSFMASWMQFVGQEEPASSEFIQQLNELGNRGLENFSKGNYNEYRVKLVLDEMKRDGTITDFSSCAKEPERIFSKSRNQTITIHSPCLVKLNDQQIRSGRNLQNDELKIDALICKQLNGETIYCPLQIKSQYRSKERNSQLVLNQSQLDELKRSGQERSEPRFAKTLVGDHTYTLPVHYEYAIQYAACLKSKSTIKEEILKSLNDSSRTFRSATEFNKLQGMELLKALMSSNLLIIR